jgi:hypothetical protein
MEPITTASAFATIVGLICNFRQERGAQEVLDHQQFIQWLNAHGLEAQKAFLLQNTNLLAEVDKLLREDRKLMLEKLDAIHATLANLLANVAEYRDLALSVLPNAGLSAQAVSILRQFVNSNSQYFVFIDHDFGSGLRLQEGKQMEYTEPRFLKDDLENLAALGLLTREFNGSNYDTFHITRNASRFIAAITEKISVQSHPNLLRL